MLLGCLVYATEEGTEKNEKEEEEEERRNHLWNIFLLWAAESKMIDCKVRNMLMNNNTTLLLTFNAYEE